MVLSRNQTIATLDALEVAVRPLLGKHDTVGGASEREAWRSRATDAFAAIAPSWQRLVAEPMSRSGVMMAREAMQTLRDRVKRDAPTQLDDPTVDLLALRAKLFIWGDHLADMANGLREVIEFSRDDDNAFADGIVGELNLARRALAATVPPDVLDVTIQLVAGKVDRSSFSETARTAETWHAGWALMTLGCLVADAVGDPVHLHGRQLCTVPQLVRSRMDLLNTGSITCPGCDAAADVPRSVSARFAAQTWFCDECSLVGYFPEKPPKASAWSKLVPADEPSALPVASLSRTRAASSPPDLSWMNDLKLREIANDDFDEMERCLEVGANKCALFAAGSACEAMLLDVLERNEKVSRFHLRKPDDWPDRMSLDVMIKVLHEEGILTDTHAAAASAIAAHRDLVHPNRKRASTITVDGQTANLLATAARIFARDLRTAEIRGALATFAAKLLGG